MKRYATGMGNASEDRDLAAPAKVAWPEVAR